MDWKFFFFGGGVGVAFETIKESTTQLGNKNIWENEWKFYEAFGVSFGLSWGFGLFKIFGLFTFGRVGLPKAFCAPSFGLSKARCPS